VALVKRCVGTCCGNATFTLLRLPTGIWTTKLWVYDLRTNSDLWAPVLGDGIDLAACLKRLEKLF
jgi:hypothetical protein